MNITCILPVFNGERFLAEALESVFAQDHPRLDMVVVDDGSTDGTAELLTRFQGRIRVLRQEQRGCAAARNLGLRESSGELVAFQDADDLWMPGKLRLQEARFEADPRLELCVGLVQNFWMDEVAEEEAAYREHRFSAPVPGFTLPALLARRSLFDRVGGFNEGLRCGSDTDWFLRARDAGAVEEVLPELLTRRRLHAGNLTRGDLASRPALLHLMKNSLDRRRKSGGG